MVTVFLVVFPVVERPLELGIAIGICLAGVPVYYVCVKQSKKSSKFCAFMDHVTSICQLLCFGLPEEEQEETEEQQQQQRQVLNDDEQ